MDSGRRLRLVALHKCLGIPTHRRLSSFGEVHCAADPQEREQQSLEALVSGPESYNTGKTPFTYSLHPCRMKTHYPC